MKKINLLIGYYAYYGEKFIKEIIKKESISTIYNAASELSYEDIRRIKTPGITRCPYSVGTTANYVVMCDMNKLPALSKELLEQMLPYESMILKLGQRQSNFPTIEYEDEKRNYHKHLRFWNHVFDKYRINAVYFDSFPHVQYTYVIYCLALLRKIPMFICSATSIPEIRVYGNNLESIGENINDYYQNKAKYLPEESVRLSGSVAGFYDKYRGPADRINHQRKREHFAEHALKRTQKIYFGSYIGISGIFRPEKAKLRLAASAIIKHHRWSWYRDQREHLKQVRKDSYMIRYYLRYQAMSLKDYDRIAQEPDYGKKYIYFGLQLTPEESTIPRAGVFAEQYTSVQLLARAAEKNNVMVYVKEHFVQPFRDREIYRMLARIPNVCLIKSSVSSFDLMEHSIAVATQTGTCILEGALRGKPALVTGRGYNWKGLPTLFEIVDEDQGAEVIHNILKGFYVSLDAVKRYFYAIQECSIRWYCPEKASDTNSLKYREILQEKITKLDEFFQKITED